MKIFAYPGYLIGSEISKPINRGYQQFLKNRQDRGPRHRRPLEGSAAVHRRTKRRPGIADPVQRIAGHGQRVLSLRPGKRPRHAGSRQAETPLEAVERKPPPRRRAEDVPPIAGAGSASANIHPVIEIVFDLSLVVIARRHFSLAAILASQRRAVAIGPENLEAGRVE